MDRYQWIDTEHATQLQTISRQSTQQSDTPINVQSNQDGCKQYTPYNKYNNIYKIYY